MRKSIKVLLVLLIFTTLLPFRMQAEGTFGMLLNGSFEDVATQEWGNKTYLQPDQALVPHWNTTSTDEKIELYKANANTYINGVTLKPSDGLIGAELNAEEESTLYQVVTTEPSSLYEWGLDHGARTSANTMALIIGPNQTNAPSKNFGEGYDKADLSLENPPLRQGYKYGKDQLMQMVEWLKAVGKIGDVINTPGIANNGQAIVIYSKKFGEHGEFLDNADGKPFSLKPSSVYTERWYIWIMTDNCSTTGENSWGSYGLNDETNTNKYYLYKVPEGQTETLFSFVSIQTTPKVNTSYPDPTFGNFLDNINFKVYRKLTGSTSTHGSGVVGTSDGNVEGEENIAEYEVTVDNELATYVADGDTLVVKATVKAQDADSVSFAGLFYTYIDINGNLIETFLNKGNGLEKTDNEGNISYSYALNNIASSVNLHFVFIKSPLITYDSNGGKPYMVLSDGSNVATEADNVYSFLPEYNAGFSNFVEPYFSHIAEGQNEDWKFIDWSVFSDEGLVAVVPAEHEISCDYEYDVLTGATNNKQDFKIYENAESFNETTNTNGVTYTPEGAYTLLKEIYATGLTLVANWKWKHEYIPQLDGADSPNGGSVSISLTGENNANGKGSIIYYSEGNEEITVTANTNEGYIFNGWFDENGNLVTLENSFTYFSELESTPKYYASFSKKIINEFKRMINGTVIEDDDLTVPALDHTRIESAKGEYISSTASNNSAYAFECWYDAMGVIVSENKTLGFNARTDGVYYANYVEAKTVNFERQFQDANGNVTPTTNSVYGTLSAYSINGTTGEKVTSKAYPGTGYYFVGWFNEDGSPVASEDDPIIIRPIIGGVSPVTYYARFAPRTDVRYVVNHIFKEFNGTNDKKVTETFTGTTGVAVTPNYKTGLTGEYEGYVYSSGVETKTVAANGSTTFNIYYTRTQTELIYNKNHENATGEMASSTGYVGNGVTIKANEFSLDGYKFNGWNTQADGNGINYSPDEVYMLLANEEGVNPNVLYAIWVPQVALSYKVQHYKTDKNGVALGSYDENEYFALEGADVIATVKSYDGYILDLAHSDTVSSGIVPASGSLILKLFYKPAEDVLTYKPNGGTGNDYVENGYIDETLVVQENMFTRPGYTFNGWKDVNGNTYAPNDAYILTTKVDILYAQWKANTDTPYKIEHYTVSTDGNSAVLYSFSNENGATGKTVSASPITINGYNVKTDLNNGDLVSKQTGVIAGDGSLVLRLYYVPVDITLTYNANGGIGADKVYIQKYGTDTNIIENPFSKSGYHFVNWTDYNPGDYYVFRENKTLYAQWAPNDDTAYKVEFYLTDSQGNIKSLYKSETRYGTTDTQVDVENEGATIAIANYLYDTDNPNKITSGTIKADGSLVLKLYYSPETDKLTYKNGEEKYEQTGYIGENVDILDCMFTKTGYTFAGWEKPDGNLYSEDTYTLTNEEDVLVATWVANTNTAYKVIHIRLDKNGNEVERETENLSGETGSHVSASAKAYQYYRFNSTNPSNVTEGDIKADGSLELVLYYTPLASAIVYYSNDGQDLYEVRNSVMGDTLTIEGSLFTRNKYEFKGWNTAPDGNGDDIEEGDTLLLEESVYKLYAMWQKKQGNATFKANGGEGNDVAVSGDIDEIKQTIANPFTRNGYIFKGWALDENGTGTIFAENEDFTIVEGNTIFYAIWEADSAANVRSYKEKHILYDSAGNVISVYSEETKNANIGDNITMLPISIYGYEHKDSLSTISGVIPDSGELVLIAGYQPLTAKLTYHANNETDSTNEQSGDFGTKITTLINSFTYDGKVFAGWNTAPDGSGTNVGESVEYLLSELDMHLYAMWADDVPPLVTVDIKFEPNGAPGTAVVEQGYAGSGHYVITNPFVYDGYRFKGWNTRADGSGVIYLETSTYLLSDSDNVLYAIWEEIPSYEYKIIHKSIYNKILKEETKTAKEGDYVQANDLNFTGYSFAGFSYAGTVSEGQVTDNSLELVLFYEPGDATYTVKHFKMLNDGTYSETPDETEVLTGAVEHMIEAIEKAYTGYEFDRGYVGNILSGEILPDNSLELKVYYQIKTSKIIFDSNTGENKTFQNQIGKEFEIIQNPFSREGYEFVEWNSASDGSGTKMEVGSTVNFKDSDVTYYAIWKEKVKEPEKEPDKKPEIAIPERKPIPETGVGRKMSFLEFIWRIIQILIH